MLELLSEFAAFNQAVQAEHIGIEDDEDQVMLTQDLPPNISDNLHLEHSKPPTGISFMAAKATETHHSFLHVITVLQDIERRHYTLNKIEMN
ncbi:hypothetical protein BGZ46_009675 [Entomortierella lignicola]|nr:hypothetical protein BGZ46_009675 [Entomortierella lignicola]